MRRINLCKILTLALTTSFVLSGCGQDVYTTSKTNNTSQETVAPQEIVASQETVAPQETVALQENATATANAVNASNTSNTSNVDNTGNSDNAENSGLLSGKYHVNIVIKDKGTIAVELDADVAPITVTNFVNLANEGFYDGVVFHRIMEGFMMQGGDPTGTGSGGSGTRIKGEFALNGVGNNLSHIRGAISMARSQNMDSASSQFFIVHEDSLFLDGQYACFGYVTQGMEIVDDICENTMGGDDNGIIPVENRPVIETIEVVD